MKIKRKFNYLKTFLSNEKYKNDNLIISIIVSLVFLSISICYIIFVKHQELDYSLNSIKSYMFEWGSLIGIITSLLITYLIAVTPKRVDDKIIKISDAIQSPLNEFHEIFNETCDILNWIEADKDSYIFITSATPIFGIELDESYQRRWIELLERRLKSKFKTTLYCLDWQPKKDSEVSTSPLYTFIETLYKYSLLPNNKTIMDIFSLGVYSYHNLKKYNYDNFKLLCGPKPTTQVILAKKGNGETRGIIYFTTKRLDNSHIVSGIKTSDFKWNRIMENIIEFCQENNSFNALEKLSVFNWSEIQINRSLELFESQLSIKPSEIILINSFNISIANGVFPPHMGKSTELLIKAIDLVCGKLKDNNKRICGVDIGTGTGILGLCLQRYCKNTILTDISERAIENARENFKRNSVSGKFYICNLLNDNIISSINSNEYPVSVFNYPFYPSLFTLSDENITGLQIIDEFIFKIKQVISDKGVVILPGNSIIGVNFDPSSIATKYGLHTHKTSISEEENFVYLIFSISQEKTYNFNCI